MDERISKVIVRAVADAERYPFLFVGSGLSRRYMGSPNWTELLERLCDEILGDRYAFADYRARARSAVQNGMAAAELPYAATLMEGDLNSALLRDGRHTSFRSRHEEALRSGQSPMKTYVADVVSGHNISLGTETKLLSRAGRDKISGIITTNYDTLCEALFPSFKVYVGESDLLFSEPSFAQELYKIHGSVGNPDSLVLTEADYAEFSTRRKYLSAKLLTIFAEYPVIFLGYSLHDDNVKSILADICECVPNGKLERLRDRMTFVEHGKATRVSDHTMDLGGRLLPMTRITTDDFSSVYEGILRSRRLYSPRVIRELKGNVFRLAEKIDPTSEVVTSGFDTLLNRLDPNQKIAIQIAVSPVAIGKPITPEDIYQDVLLDDLGMDHRFIVDNYLNAHVQRLAGAVPFYKYTGDLGDEVGKPVERYRAKFSSLDSFRTESDKGRMDSIHRRFEGVNSVASLAEACLPKRPFVFVPCLRDEEIDVKELGALLVSALLATDERSPERKELLKDSAFRKCVRIYDFLRYARR